MDQRFDHPVTTILGRDLFDGRNKSSVLNVALHFPVQAYAGTLN